jgi:hypothetical protein
MLLAEFSRTEQRTCRRAGHYMMQPTQLHAYRSALLAHNTANVARLQFEEARDLRLVWQRPCLSKPVYHVLQQFIAWIQYLQHLSVHLLLLILAQRCLQHLTLAHTLGTAEGRAKED